MWICLRARVTKTIYFLWERLNWYSSSQLSIKLRLLFWNTSYHVTRQPLFLVLLLFGNWVSGSQCQNITDIVLVNTLSIVFDPEVLCFLQVSMKLLQTNFLICKKSKISDPSEFLTDASPQ